MKIKTYFKLFRPFTLLAPIVGGIFFSYKAIIDHYGSFNIEFIPLIILNGFILAIANASSNIFNQVFDIEIDRINKPDRPLPKGEIKIEEAISIGILLIILDLVLSGYFFNSLYVFLLGLILIFTWLYNNPPLRLRMKLFWSNLAIATPRGGLGIIAAYSAFNYPTNEVLLAGFIFALYIFGVNTLKDFPDEAGDKMLGVRNFVTVYGKRGAKLIVSIFSLIPFIILYIFSPIGIIPIVSMKTAVYETIPFLLSIPMNFILGKKRLYKKDEIKLWRLFYIQYSLMILLFAL
jgi:4-hydroxybenzoate polyprenyltransferase